MAHVSPERPLCLFLIDLDDFKDVNDTFGHLEGDSALKMTADVLRATSARENAFAARWGGDEFILICTDAVDIDPDRIAESIRGSMASAVRESHAKYSLTCSVGYALCKSHVDDCARVIAQADKMLYEMKRDGK